MIGLSALGLILSALVHLGALLDQPNPFGHWVWGLHFGIFVVWMPTIAIAASEVRGGGKREFWRLALRGCPEWYRYLLYGLLAYAVINLAIFMMRASGLPRGAEMSEAMNLIGFSGHWMVFYAAALGVSWSFVRAGDSTAPRCANGHLVAIDSRFCPECGCPIESVGDPPGSRPTLS